MDKNTLIGFLLIGVVLFAFSWFNRPTPEQIEAQRRVQDSIAKVEYERQMEQKNVQPGENKQSATDLFIEGEPDSVRMVRLHNTYGAFANAMNGKEDFIVLQNDLVELKISNKGGRVASARLKDYETYDGKPLVLFTPEHSSFDITLVTANNRVVNTADMYFTPVKQDAESVVMRLNAGEGAYMEFEYSLKPDSYLVDFNIKSTGMNGILAPTTNALDIKWVQKIPQQEKGRKYENQLTGLYYKFLADDVENLNEVKDADAQLSNRLKWIAYKDKFFSTVLIAENYFAATTLESKVIPEGEFLKQFTTITAVPFDLKGQESVSFRYFFGPNKYALLKSFNKGVEADQQWQLEKLVPLGASIFRLVNQYVIIPIFDFLSKFLSSYGLIIFLLTLIVKLFLFPLTYKSYMSSAKMRVLRPQVEEINAKYPGSDKAMERQKATMELYSRAGASPLSGCLPMLLQMPILIAMYMFFPSAIELRHQSFLWAHDLSTYDAIISWNTYIPIITPYFGNHISLFCLLMTITNIIYTKFNMDQTNTGQQQMPGMKAMMYMMPLMFLVFFNQNASGLSYYYFVSTLITIIQTLIFRYTINEEKLLAKLEANKKKPMKKSGFMARLEEAQRKQQEQVRKQQQAKKKR
ncbi:membrane protein insertase YidC [Parabacteroides pacaensis]|uniref:membrane protein insertase YidC n=1 Tax=Parabacteroides pacaensis TaxID=2086575 RepID=UPI000D113071|nr:membrane protein insertase YidC [Parabacteroides pacaensis]